MRNKMRILLILVLPILFIACTHTPNLNEKNSNNSTNKSIDSLETFSITPNLLEDYIHAKKNYINKIKFDTSIFKKENSEIKLPMNEKWRTHITFKDSLLNNDETDFREYNYIGQIDTIGFYIVEANYWEHFEYYLINKNSGKQIILWNIPFVSPNIKYIANLSMPYGLEGVPNGIQVWKINYNQNNQSEPITISKQLEIDQQNWAAEDLVWESDNTLILKVISLTNDLNETILQNNNKYYYLRLKI